MTEVMYLVTSIENIHPTWHVNVYEYDASFNMYLQHDKIETAIDEQHAYCSLSLKYYLTNSTMNSESDW